MELLNTDCRVNELKLISKLVLCDDELSSVNFFSNGEECIVTSFLTGQFFYISVSLQCSSSLYCPLKTKSSKHQKLKL